MTASKRLLRLCAVLAALLVLGLLYAAFVGATGLGVPCIFRLITGLECPGCGVSRMCMALLKLDFRTAWHSNPAVTALLPLGAAVASDMAARYVRTGTSRPDKFCNAAMIFMLAVLAIFGFVRNIV